MGRKAKVCFPRLSARLSVHKYLCECSVPVTLQNKGNHLLGLSKEKGDCLTQQAAGSPGFPGRCGPSPAFATPEFKDWMQSFVLVFDVGKPKHSILSFVWILSLYYPSWTSHNLKLAALNTFGSCEACKGERKRKCSWMCASVYHSELLALSLITSFYCFFFFSGFLGSSLVELRRVSAFLWHLQCLPLWLCTAFVSLGCPCLPRSSLGRCAGPAWAQCLSKQ